MKLWDFQVETIAAYEEASVEKKRLLIVLPTGGGKTVVAAEIIKREVASGGRVLFLAMPREQVDQAVKRLVAWGVAESDIGTILAQDERSSPSAPIQVATLGTIRARNFKSGTMPPATLVVVDEAHHAVANTYMAILACYPKTRVLGLTATPMRLDGRGLGDAGFEGLIVGATTMQLGNLGHLTMPRVWGIGDADLVDFKGIKVDAYGDFAKGDAAAKMSRAKIVGRHVEHYEKHGGGRSAVVYACTIEHAKIIGSRFSKAGHEVELLFGETSIDDRRRILARLDRAEQVIVVNVGVLTEGWDCPAAKVCILARPTLSWTLHMQMIGRFLRPWGTSTPTILDHAGNVCRLGMPDAEREFKLVMPKQGKGLTKSALAKECEACGQIVPLGAETCPGCGVEFPKRTLPEELDENLVEYTGSMRERLLYVAKERGYHPGWVDFALRELEKAS